MNCRKKCRKWWRSRNQGIVISNCLKQFANSEKQFANDSKEFVKAKRAIYKLITSTPKVTTAQIAVVYPRTISPAPQKNDFWVKVILHIIVFP